MANEQFAFGNIPVTNAGYGIRTQHGILLPPGGKVAAFVRSTGLQDGDDAVIADKLVATLASGLARCRAGMGDVVICLPGHSESVADSSMLTNLVAGTRVIGIPLGTSTPTFRWTAAGSTWAVDDANCTFSGLRLRLEGANGVTKAINVTGSDCAITDCDIEMASGASNKATIGIEVGTGANKFFLSGNRVYGTATHNVTDGIKVAAAVSELHISYNRMIFSATAANGLIHVTAAALNGYIGKNVLYNTMTSSVGDIICDDVASDGIMEFNSCGSTVGTGTAPASTGIVFAGANTLWRCIENYSTPTKNTSGDIAPARDT